MEIYFDVKTVMVQMMCDSCKEGYFLQTGKVQRSISAGRIAYEHKCEKCGHIVVFRGMAYPQLRQVVAEVPLDPQPDYAYTGNKPSVPLDSTNLNKL